MAISVIQIILSFLIIGLILLQQRGGGGLSPAIGGGGGFYTTYKGVERKIFYLTVALIGIFIALSLFSLF